jgi:hypothetical protein
MQCKLASQEQLWYIGYTVVIPYVVHFESFQYLTLYRMYLIFLDKLQDEFLTSQQR